MLIQVAWTATLLPALLIGIHWAGPTGAGLAHLAVCLVVVLPACLIALRRDQVNITDLVVRCIPPVAAALVAGLVAFVFREAIGSPWLTVVTAGGVASLVYLVLMVRWVRGAVTALGEYQEPLDPDQPGDLIGATLRPVPPVGDEV